MKHEERSFTVIAIGKNGKAFNLGTHAGRNAAEAILKARQQNEAPAIKAIGEIERFEAREDFL